MSLTQTEVTEPALMTCKQLALYLSVSPRHIATMDTSGDIPASVRLKGSVRWRREEIDAWLEAGCPCRQVWNARRD